MASSSIFACCVSRDKGGRQSNVEINKEIMKEKLRGQANADEDNSAPQSPRTPPSAFAKSFRFNKLGSSTGKYNQSGEKTLGVSRGNSTDDSFNVEKYESNSNMKPYSYKQWKKILRNNDLANTSSSELVHSLRHGCPDELRPQIWDFLTNIEELKKQHPADFYKTLKDAPNSYDDQIKKDINRTFPSHHFFKANTSHGQKSLFSILRAYANYDKEIGYTQGMNFVVGKILIILDPENYVESELEYFEHYEKEYEEKAFWIFFYLLTVKNCRQIYKDHFAKIHEMSAILNKRLKENVPEIHDIIENSEIEVNNCFYSMFICLLLDSTPTTVAKRLIDIFLIEGEQILFKVILRAIMISKKEIVAASEDSSAGNLHRLLKHDLMVKAYKQHRNQIYVLFPGAESV